jgi:hypothetical protein
MVPYARAWAVYIITRGVLEDDGEKKNLYEKKSDGGKAFRTGSEDVKRPFVQGPEKKLLHENHPHLASARGRHPYD